jgi:hypothetical protein
MISEAYMEPKERQMWIGLSTKTKEVRKIDKRKRGEIKNSRKSNRSDDYE